MSKHTHGNWDANHFTRTDKIEINGGKLRLLKDAGGVIIAFLPQWLDHEDEAAEAKANAFLMQSAPDLLEACQAINALDPQKSSTGDWNEAFKLIAAAISKATGGQQ